MPTPRSLSAIDSDSDSSYSEPSVLEISSGEEDEPSGDPNVIEVSSDEDGNMQASASAASNNVFQADGEAVPGSKANPISVATPSPVKKHPKRPRGRPDSPESPSPLPSRKNRRVEDAAAADARALRILEGNMRVDTNPASLLAMARAGLQALKATKLVLPDPRMVPIPRARPGQAATEPVEFLSVAQERQMLEWEGYQVLRTAFVGAALDVLKGLDPDAPYVVVRRRYTLYVDPFQKPPHPLRVDPAHRCCSCNSLASHPVLLWCNHLFCFVCVRLHLNKSWDCPKEGCGARQRRPPWRRMELAEEIKQVYTGFADLTQVTYGWSDVHFPQGGSSSSNIL